MSRSLNDLTIESATESTSDWWIQARTDSQSESSSQFGTQSWIQSSGHSWNESGNESRIGSWNDSTNDDACNGPISVRRSAPRAVLGFGSSTPRSFERRSVPGSVRGHCWISIAGCNASCADRFVPCCVGCALSSPAGCYFADSPSWDAVHDLAGRGSSSFESEGPRG